MSFYHSNTICPRCKKKGHTFMNCATEEQFIPRMSAWHRQQCRRQLELKEWYSKDYEGYVVHIIRYTIETTHQHWRFCTHRAYDSLCWYSPDAYDCYYDALDAGKEDVDRHILKMEEWGLRISP